MINLFVKGCRDSANGLHRGIFNPAVGQLFFPSTLFAPSKKDWFRIRAASLHSTLHIRKTRIFLTVFFKRACEKYLSDLLFTQPQRTNGGKHFSGVFFPCVADIDIQFQLIPFRVGDVEGVRHQMVGCSN